MSETPVSGRFAHRFGGRWSALGVAVALAVGLAACGSDDDASTGATDISSASTDSVTLVTYDSFPDANTSLNDALAEFGAENGIEVDILVAGDTGTMLSKASLTAGNPEGDVMWGVDNASLSRAIDDEVFEPYVARAIADGTIDIAPEFLDLVPNGEATPVDYGDVCVNYDIDWYAERNLDPPTSFTDLTDPAYAGQLVVQNAATSSPGLAFLLATIHEYGLEGWQDYWSRLGQNGVEVVDSWNQAYYERFTWAGGGPTPMVVSYGSSPPAEVIFAEPPRDDAPTGVIEDTCFRQVEFAGVLRGTDAPDAARVLVDFLISDRFQRELALNLFVYPTNQAVDLPQEFVDFAVVPETSRTLDPTLIDAERSTWIDEWTELVLG
ncbi:MAG TPA: thiamine ABC transporter substrate-binding protein [Ilumatobacteraceae bacterium]|nr:thiamine ABC transporter substrate-binding protein [Ilumatobacteraceae bacterium]